MARHRGPVLVDTNVILECWRVTATAGAQGTLGGLVGSVPRFCTHRSQRTRPGSPGTRVVFPGRSARVSARARAGIQGEATVAM